MGTTWKQRGAVTLAASVLGLLMLQAGMAGGCGGSGTDAVQAEPSRQPAHSPAARAESTSKAATSKAATKPSSPAATSEKRPAATKLPPAYGPASKAGPVFYPSTKTPKSAPPSQAVP